MDGLSIAKEIGVLYQEMAIYEFLSVSYEGLGKFDQSLLHYKEYTQKKDSIFNTEKNKQIEEAEAKFQYRFAGPSDITIEENAAG